MECRKQMRRKRGRRRTEPGLRKRERKKTERAHHKGHRQPSHPSPHADWGIIENRHNCSDSLLRVWMLANGYLPLVRPVVVFCLRLADIHSLAGSHGCSGSLGSVVALSSSLTRLTILFVKGSANASSVNEPIHLRASLLNE